MGDLDLINCLLCGGSSSIERYPVLFPDTNDVIFTDLCIGREIQALVNAGVKTLGCCCGHGSEPECLVSESSCSLLESMGYALRSFSEKHDAAGIKEIVLKTDVQAELRKVLTMKPWRYLPRMIPVHEEQTRFHLRNESGS